MSIASETILTLNEQLELKTRLLDLNIAMLKDLETVALDLATLVQRARNELAFINATSSDKTTKEIVELKDEKLIDDLNACIEQYNTAMEKVTG